MSAQLSPELVQDFVFAGRSRFTLVSKKTAKRFTFRVDQKPDRPAFVSVLTGSCNESDYTFIGTVFAKAKFKHSPKSTIGPNAPSVKAFEWFAENGIAGLEFWHEGRCGRCARPLTDPESIARGFGPECIKSL